MASQGDKVVARLPFGYNGKFRDRGEVFLLGGFRNDEKLVGNRYVLPFDSAQHKEISCDHGCGRFFASMTFLENHYRKKNCNDDDATPNRIETAELIGADPSTFKMDDDNGPRQKVTNFDNQIAGR